MYAKLFDQILFTIYDIESLKIASISHATTLQVVDNCLLGFFVDITDPGSNILLGHRLKVGKTIPMLCRLIVGY